MDTDGLVLQHQGISSHSADYAPMRLPELRVNTVINQTGYQDAFEFHVEPRLHREITCYPFLRISASLCSMKQSRLMRNNLAKSAKQSWINVVIRTRKCELIVTNRQTKHKTTATHYTGHWQPDIQRNSETTDNFNKLIRVFLPLWVHKHI